MSEKMIPVRFDCGHHGEVELCWHDCPACRKADFERREKDLNHKAKIVFGILFGLIALWAVIEGIVAYAF